MATNSTRPSGSRKDERPKKPSPDFPLYPHKVGRWAKKVKGRVVYFTRWRDDPKGVAALEEWLDQKDDLLAGRTPRPKKEDELVLGDLCNEFLAHKESLRDNGELSPRTFETYYSTCERLCKYFRRDRAVVDLTPADFRQFRDKLSKTRGAVALGNEITRVRSVFRFAFDEGIILAPVRFGQGFAKPRKEVADAAREKHRAENGLRMLEADELRAVIAAAKQPLKAMVLLAANTGFGNTDLSNLPIKAIDLDKGWADFARVKNATPRRVPLWPETIEAIREWIPQRPKAKEPADAGLLFLTRWGQRWVKVHKSGAPADAIGQEFSKVLRTLGLKRPRLSFYALRHGFETIAGDTADQVAVDAIMGHSPKGMAGVYRERISDARLLAVTEHVRQWLFGSEDAEPAPDRKNSEVCDPNDPATRGSTTRKQPDAGLQGSQTREDSEPGRKGRKGRKIPESISTIGRTDDEGGFRLRVFAG